MSTLRLLAIFVVFISLALLAHEAGHMYAAQAFGVTVEKFSIGFGKPIVSWYIGNVKYQIGPLLVGGSAAINQQSLAEKSLIVRLLVILAGPVANLLSFIFCLSWYLTLTAQIKGSEINIEGFIITIKIRKPKGDKKISTIKKFFIILFGTLRATGGILSKFAKAAFRKGALKKVTGPLGILESYLELAKEKFSKSWKKLIFEFSLLSFGIGFINLIPAPFLDGGRAVLVVLEEIFGPSQIYSQIFFISLCLALILFILLTTRDSLRILKRIFGGRKKSK